MRRFDMAIRTIALLAALPAAADPFYAGIMLGATRESGDYADQVVRARSGDPAPPTDVRLESDNQLAGRAFVGMKLAPNVGIEADYADLGQLSSHAMWHGPDPFFQFERFGRIDVRAAAITVLGSVAIAERTGLFARAGAAYTWVDYETTGSVFIRTPDGHVASSPSPTPPGQTGNGWCPVLALGIDHRLGERWSVRGEWVRYFDVGTAYTPLAERGKFDLDLASIGIAYRF